MGISGLLPLLKEAQEPGHIRDFRGKRLAVDAYVWLHKGAFGCAEDLVKGKKTTAFVNYAMHRVNMLRLNGVEPFIVFDGGPLPAKKGTEDSRAKSRADHMAKALAFESQGRWKDARDCYTKCIDITPEMAYQLIKALKAADVEYIVAPYEADAQLCFLEREGYVDGVITEDSDLLVFGCKVVVFKMDKDGNCVYVKRTRMATVRDLPMHGWTDTQFRRMAMLSGCDYLPSIVGIGLKKAHRLLRRLKTVERVVQSIRLEGAHLVPDGYIEAFNQAELAFLHQRVYCPHQKRLVPLCEFPSSGLSSDDEKWIGLDVEPEVAQGMAKGDLHPETRQPIEDLWPNFNPPPAGRSKPPGLSASGSNGTLDGFGFVIRRTQSARVAPAVGRVGSFSSGAKTLSQLPSGRKPPTRCESQPTAGNPVNSKYFQKEDADLDSSQKETQEVESQREETLRSPTPEVTRSSPPLLSPPFEGETRLPTPIRMSSPSSHVSSPHTTPFKGAPFSSPEVDPGNHWGRFPSPAPTERSEPPSPTPTKRVLVAASSQFSEAPQITLPCAEQTTPSRPCIVNVLVPASSGATALAVAFSSDSAGDEEIVTPTAVEQKKLKRKQVTAEHEPTDEERAAQRRASIVAEGWRAKYAFGASSSSSPASGSAPRKSGAARVAPVPKTSKVPLSSALGVLAARDTNVDISAGQGDLHVSKPKKTGSATSAAAPATKPKSHGMSCAALQKFRFTR